MPGTLRTCVYLMLKGEEVQVLKADVTKAHLVHLAQVILQLAQRGEVDIRTTQRARVVLETVERISSFPILKQNTVLLRLEQPPLQQFIITGNVLTEYNLRTQDRSRVQDQHRQHGWMLWHCSTKTQDTTWTALLVHDRR